LGLTGRVVSSSRCAKCGKWAENFIFYFLFVVFIGFIFLFLSFVRFCLKVSGFWKIGWLTFFVSFVFFVTGKGDKFGCVTFFVRDLV
jgi:hypothetical protein